MPVVCLNNWKAPSGGIAVVQTASGTTADGSAGLTVNFGVPVTAGNSVVALLSREATGGGFGTPQMVDGDASALAFIPDTPFDGTAFQVAIGYVHIAAGGETGVVWTTTAVRASMTILEISGLANAAAEDTGTNSGNSTSITVDGFSNTTPVALCVAVGAWNANNYDTGPVNGWTRIGTGTGGASVYQESGYLITTVAEPQGTEWGLTGSADYAWAAAVFGGA